MCSTRPGRPIHSNENISKEVEFNDVRHVVIQHQSNNAAHSSFIPCCSCKYNKIISIFDTKRKCLICQIPGFILPMLSDEQITNIRQTSNPHDAILTNCKSQSPILVTSPVADASFIILICQFRSWILLLKYLIIAFLWVISSTNVAN